MDGKTLFSGVAQSGGRGDRCGYVVPGSGGDVSGERQHGHKVGAAVEVLSAWGFKVRRLEHGLPEWAAGLPVDTDSEQKL